MKHEELLTLAQQASYLPERLAGNWRSASGSQPQQMAQTRLQRWCQMAAGGDWARFGERLAWDGIDSARALQLVTDGKMEEWQAAADWTAILAEALNHDLAAQPVETDMQPFLFAAHEQLRQRADAKLAWLAPQAQQALTHSLQQRLRAQIKPTLDHLHLLPSSQGRITLPALCRTYPVLARQLATSVVQWVDGCTEFLLRLEADWLALGTMIHGNEGNGDHEALAPGAIANLHCDLSDPHAGGRTVWAVTLAPHLGRSITVAYKPKVITLDRAWNELLVYCNQQGLLPQLNSLWTLPRQNYGWMAWAKSESSNSDEQALYYQRVGMVLGLLQVLQATDCHAENLVTHGDQLLLVDAEMLRYPQMRGQQWADPLDVVRTGLLPRWRVSQNGVAEMDSLLSIDPDMADNHRIVADGYAKMMHFLNEHWTEFTGSGGILSAFAEGAVRFAPRPTQAYLRLIDYLRHPAFLQRGVDFSIGVDQLARSYLDHSQHRPLHSLLALEHAALNRGDVPRFSIQIGQADWEQSLCAEARRDFSAPLPTPGASAGNFIWQPLTLPTPFEQAQQRRLISESLDQPPYLSPVPESTFLAAALHLGRLLLDRAIPLAEGKLGWIANQFQPRSGLYQYGLVGDDLYGGRAGIAPFLAALYAITQEKPWHRAALAALAPCPTDEATAIRNAGGRLYVLSVCAKLLNEADLLRHAVTLSAESSVRAPTAILDWGVLDGLAGYLLGLLTLYDHLEDPCQQQRLFPLLTGCAGQLLASQADWQDQGHALGGFAHGAAGIAYALTRCAALPGHEHCLRGAEQGWTFQRRLYHEPPGNWQDRRGVTPVYLHNWCNGAAGIGLAAAASLSTLPYLSDVVERAATLLLEIEEPVPLDTLCCGRFGQIDCLLQMGRVMGRRPWIHHAQVLAQHQLQHAARAGYFQLYDELPSQHFNPTFFRGIAGIGYTLLRLAAASGEIKQSIPSVLAWAS